MSSAANKRYRYSSLLIDLSVLPTNIFNLKGDIFYKLVQELTSEDVEKLLKIQKISSARSFLNTNPLAFFDLKSDDPPIVELQKRLSYKATDNKNIILAGIDGDILYLKQLFESFLLENKKKMIYPVNSTTTDHMPPPNTTSTMTSMSTSIDQSETNQFSIIEHRKYLTQQIKIWWENHRNDYDLDDDALTEPDDYELIINDNSAMIKCSCKQKINLPLVKERKHYQLSNFYKHLTRNDQCTVIKRKCVTPMSDEDNDDDDSPTSLSLPVSSSSQRLLQGTTITKNNQQPKRSSDNSFNSLSKRKRHRRK